MSRYSQAIYAAAVLFAFTTAHAQTPDDPCLTFPWDVSTISAAFAKGADRVDAAAARSRPLPELAVETAYELELLPQSDVAFDVGPGKPTLDDGSTGGFVRFRVPSNGRYLVAMTSGHWIDVVDGDTLVQSVDFQGARGCERPRKIVEFELHAERELVLQLSGGVDPTVAVVIAPAIAAANPAAGHADHGAGSH